MAVISICQHCGGALPAGEQPDGSAVICPECGQAAPGGVAVETVPAQRRRQVDAAAILAIRRPSPRLLTYYILRSLVTGPLFPILIIPQYFRYHTMHYRFEAEGIAMGWGILFRREIVLNYSRIQDIHLSSNLLERWLGLARIQIQTASGSAQAEMTLEGLVEFEAVRDFLYDRMRGIKDAAQGQAATGAASPLPAGGALVLDASAAAELTTALRATAAELRAARLALESRPGESAKPTNAR